MEERYLKMEEVADIMSVDKSTVYKWIREKRFPAPHKFGGASRWLLSEITRYGQSTVPGDYPNSPPIPASCAASPQ